MSERLNVINLVVGAPGHGKTTKILELLKRYPRKILIYDINKEKAYSDFPLIELKDIRFHSHGIARVFTPDTRALVDAIDKHYYNGLVVFEDATKYLPSGVANVFSWRSIFTNYRHRNRDYIFTFHSLNRIPPFVYEMSNYITLFKTKEQFDGSLKKVPNFSVVQTAYNKVQKAKDKFYNVTVSTGA